MLRLYCFACLLLLGTACEKSWVGDPRWELYSPASTGLLENGQPDLEGQLLFNEGNLYVAGYVLTRFDGQEWQILYRNAPADYYTALAFAPDNRLWMARREVNAGSTRLQYYENEEWRSISLPDSLKQLQIRDFSFETAERFWMATNGGLLRYENGNWSLQNSSNSNLPNNNLHRIFQREGQLFLFSTGSIPRIMQQQGNSWILLNQANAPLPIPLNDLRLDAAGRFWLGGGGVTRWNPSSNSWQNWSERELELQTPLRRIAIWGNDFWMATRNGLLGYQDGKIQRYTASDSRIVSNRCVDLRFGPQGNLWISLGADEEAGYRSGVMRFEATPYR